MNALAQGAGIAGIHDREHWRRSLTGIAEARAYLQAELPRIHGSVLSTDCNFLLWQVEGGAGWRHALLEQGCLLRNCSSFGRALKGYLRVSVRTLPECERLVTAARHVAAHHATLRGE